MKGLICALQIGMGLIREKSCDSEWRICFFIISIGGENCFFF